MMAKKQSSILSYFKPKGVGPESEQGSNPLTKRKRKSSAYADSNFIFLSSDSDDDDGKDDVKMIDSCAKDTESGRELAKVEEEMNQIGDEFCDTEPFMSVAFEEGDEEMITDSVKLTVEDLMRTDDYKWNTFRAMIDWVLKDQSNEHLFNDSDWSIVQSFTSLSVPCQRLYIRLFVRRRKWIRPSRMDYPDLGSNLQPLIDELVKARFLFNGDSITNLREGLELLSHYETKTLVKALNGIAGGSHSKGDSIQSILKLCKTSTSIKSHFGGSKETLDEVALKRVKKIVGSSAYRVNEDMSRLFSRMTYLYYPPQVNEDENGLVTSHELYNAQQVEMGVLRYPSYTIRKKEVIYKTRQDLIDYETACRLESQILVAIEKKDVDLVINKLLSESRQGFNDIINSDCKQEQQTNLPNFSQHTNLPKFPQQTNLPNFPQNTNLPNFLRNQTPGHVYTRCLHHIVTILEQQRLYSVAVEILNAIYGQDIYCQHYKGRWLERLAINYESHLKRHDDAFSVVKKGLKDPNVYFAFRYTLYLRAKRLAKSSKIKRLSSLPECPEFEFAKCPEVTIHASTLQKAVQGRKTIFTDTSGTGDFCCISVEQAALNHYLSNGYSQGLHTESKIYHSLLALLFWDIIYSDLEDAFRFKNQSLPLDFVHDQFYAQRKESIDARLEQIRKASLAELYQMMDNVWGMQMGCRSLIDWDHCDLSQMKQIVCCLGNEPIAAVSERLLRHFRFTRSGFPDLLVWDISSRNIKAVEVKGPGDSLSSKQILWLEYFNNCSFPAEVCYVKPAK